MKGNWRPPWTNKSEIQESNYSSHYEPENCNGIVGWKGKKKYCCIRPILLLPFALLLHVVVEPVRRLAALVICVGCIVKQHGCIFIQKSDKF